MEALDCMRTGRALCKLFGLDPNKVLEINVEARPWRIHVTGRQYPTGPRRLKDGEVETKPFDILLEKPECSGEVPQKEGR